MTNTVSISKAIAGDIEEVVNVHLFSFPGFFLSKLGSGFLRAYYREVLHYKHGHFFVAKRDGCVVGFVTGFYKPSSFYKKLLCNPQKFIRPLIVGVVTNPCIGALVVQKIINFLKRFKLKDSQSDTSCVGKVELSSLAVCPLAQGAGIGGQLVQVFIKSCVIYSPIVIYLTTDAIDNKAVNQFYSKLGFRSKESPTSESGRVMNEYELFVTEAA